MGDWPVLYDALIRTAIASFAVTIVGTTVALLCRQPARRIRVIELTMVTCLLAPWLWLVPGVPNWSVPLPKGTGVEPIAAAVLQHEMGVSSNPNDHIRDANRVFEAAAGEPRGQTAPFPSSRYRSQSHFQDNTGERRPIALAEVAAEPAATVTVSPAVRPAQSAGVDRAAEYHTVIVVGYVVGTAVMLCAWLAGIVCLAWLVARARPASHASAELLRAIAGLSSGKTRLLVSRGVDQPIACQFRRRVIVLPETLDTQADEQTLRWCLAHEWSHLERGDWRTWMLSGFTRAVFFYQPLVWWLRWQLRLGQDYLADAEAAGQSPSSEDYAAFLTSRASPRPSQMAIAGLGIRGRKSDLFWESRHACRKSQSGRASMSESLELRRLDDGCSGSVRRRHLRREFERWHRCRGRVGQTHRRSANRPCCQNRWKDEAGCER